MQKNYSLVWPNLSDDKNLKVKKSADFSNTTLIKNIIKRCSEIKDQTLVLTLPSAIIANDDLLTNFAENIQLLSVCEAKIFIIHDYTNLVNDTLKLFGYDQKFINNIKVTDRKSAQIIEMVLSGHINKLIVAKLCELGCNAIGISGKDANLIQAGKPRLLHKNNQATDIIDIGFISDPIMVNPEILLSLEDNDIISVISPIASDENNKTHLLDVNLTASIISSSLGADHLILACDEEILGEQDNILGNLDLLQKLLLTTEPNSNISNLIDAAICAIENTVEYVHLTNPKIRDFLLLSLFNNDINAD